MKSSYIFFYYLSFFITLPLFFHSCTPASKSEEVGTRENKIEPQTETSIIWHWDDQFSKEEKEKIQKYISTVTNAAFKILGKYPFDIHYYFNRINSENEPIPWAHTERSKKSQGVRFYINPAFDYEVFLSDWTAPHEISHLSIPFLGKENSWFAEGYASYMQYQIMQELGIYSKEALAQKYQSRIEGIQDDYSDTMSFVENAKTLRARYNFKAMYWGGARYFMEIDKLLLEKEGISLTELIRKYQSCCHKRVKHIDALLEVLDQKLKSPLFRDLFIACQSKPFGEIYE